MLTLKFENNNKNKKKVNFKVIATGVVAITLIGIVGMSIGRSGGSNPLGANVGMTAISTIGSSINSGFTFIKSGFENVINFQKNAKKAESLEKENSRLQQEVIDLQNKLDDVQSLQSLKAALNFVDEKYVAKTLSAKVVSKNDGNWYSSFVVSAGSKDGVKKDSLVMNGNGLVGIVYEVSENYCKVISLLDTKSSVSFKLAKNSEFKGIITYGENIDEKTDYRDSGLLQGYMFDSNYDVLPGDVVTTSGLGLFPEGIVIGKVGKVIEDKNNSLKYVIVKPNVDFKNIDDVVIVEPRNIN
ncbi:MAG: rod shape-determining protein MreC [Terrisporobacter othiniensis]|uniref:rod shape-determining protein MreC n=1 Tax=Terrisporobacter othiniensis TaxID=1577792 RepID=UPI002908C470|nr:rod shape-determining protein MreC [Terrisporobacter othiniensis]MDU6985144.1 rod shape-determining protein MreC [Terrisporobacter othiniensis]